MAEHGEAPYSSLYPLYILDQAHPHNGRDLLRVGFDAVLGDDKTQQHTPWDLKNTLLGVDFDTVFSELSLMPFARSFTKVCSRSATSWSTHLDLTMMSST